MSKNVEVNRKGYVLTFDTSSKDILFLITYYFLTYQVQDILGLKNMANNLPTLK